MTIDQWSYQFISVLDIYDVGAKLVVLSTGCMSVEVQTNLHVLFLLSFCAYSARLHYVKICCMFL